MAVHGTTTKTELTSYAESDPTNVADRKPSYASTPTGNIIAGDIKKEAEASNVNIASVRLIKSEENHADRPSRLHHQDQCKSGKRDCEGGRKFL